MTTTDGQDAPDASTTPDASPSGEPSSAPTEPTPDSSVEPPEPACAERLELAACFSWLGAEPERPDEDTQLFDVEATVTGVSPGPGEQGCEHFQLGNLDAADPNDVTRVHLEGDDVEFTLVLAVPGFPAHRLMGRQLHVLAEAWNHEYEGSSNELVISSSSGDTLFWLSDGGHQWEPLPLSLGLLLCEYAEFSPADAEIGEYRQHALDVTASNGDVVSIGVGETARVDNRWQVINGAYDRGDIPDLADEHISRFAWAAWQLVDKEQCGRIDNTPCALNWGCPDTYSRAEEVVRGSCTGESPIEAGLLGSACGLLVAHYTDTFDTGFAFYDPLTEELVGWWTQDDVSEPRCAGKVPAFCEFNVNEFDAGYEGDFDTLTRLCSRLPEQVDAAVDAGR